MSVILIQGNPVDGFTFIGPFDDGPAATGYAVHNLGHGDEWTTANVVAPEDDDPEMITYRVTVEHTVTVEDCTHPNDVRGDFIDWLHVHPDVVKLEEVRPERNP